MSEKRLETVPLWGGLQLEIWDASRIVAGDRWLVCLEGRLDVPLDGAPLVDSLPEGARAVSAMKGVFGETIPYRYVQERHFVDQKEKDALFAQFLEGFKNNLVPYLKHPDFAARFLLSKYKELKKKEPRLFEKEKETP
ncbi:MAG: hypothetical protein JW821_09695 [Deltaproteobacteria bacterium]|nr:hypothetical protein [Deltaproteobacteria bacterium]